MKIIHPGHSSVLRSLGAREKRAADCDALRYANLLVGNPEDAPCIEMELVGVTVLFEEDAVIALTGRELSPRLNGEQLPSYGAIRVGAGDYLCLSEPPEAPGRYAYLALSPAPLWKQGRLEQGDRIELCEGRMPEGDLSARRMMPPFVEDEVVLRVIPGPQVDRFTEEGLNSFYTTAYTVSAEPDRSVVRLSGKPLDATDYAILSEPTVVGSVQVDSHGQPSISFVDGEIRGRCVKIATVATADHPLVAGLCAGQIVRFRPITVEQAQGLLRRRHAGYRKLYQKLNPPEPAAALSQASETSEDDRQDDLSQEQT